MKTLTTILIVLIYLIQSIELRNFNIFTWYELDVLVFIIWCFAILLLFITNYLFKKL